MAVGVVCDDDVTRADAALGDAALAIAGAAEAETLVVAAAALAALAAVAGVVEFDAAGVSALPEALAAHAAAKADAVAFALVAAVVLDIAVAEYACLKAVSACGFGCFARGDDTAFQFGVLFYIHLEAVVAGKQPALAADAQVVGFEGAVLGAAGGAEAVACGYLGFDAVVFAFVNGAVLRAGDAEAAAVKADAAAEHLYAFDGGVPAALDSGVALAAAYAAVAVADALSFAFAFAVVAAGGNAEGDAAVEAEGDAGVPAGFAAAAVFLLLFGGRLQGDVAFGKQAGALFAGDVAAADADGRASACAACLQQGLAI